MSAISRMLSCLAVFCLGASVARAHPVPKDNHDRTIVARLQKGAAPDRIRVRVEYRLEVDETTVLLNDMKPFRDEVDPFHFRKEPLRYYAEFTRIFAPIYAERLTARVNKTPTAEFRCVSRQERLQDEEGMNLGHLRCDFVFETSFAFDPAATWTFFFREQNYYLEPGQVVLSWVNETGLAVEKQTVPDETFRKGANQDDDRLRELAVVFAASAAPRRETAAPTGATKAPPPETRAAQDAREDRFSLLRLILQTDYGFFLTMALAFLFGAAHALTPGHGKTLVAAYLVGERGTVWHALYLGLVTTLAHTGVVIAIAVALALLSAENQQILRAWIQNGLGLIVGLVIVCMGFWLLLQRLAGRADHVHLDGGHHHHSHESTEAAKRSFTWWGLTVLGITGGMIPCWDAVGVLGIAIGTNQMWLVLPAVLVFSAGLAVVLVAIGILVVQVPRFVESRPGTQRLARALPIISAILVTLMGLWLCYEGVHG